MAARRSGSDRVAERLRAQPPKLDDVGRARMERKLLDAVRERGEAPSAPSPKARPTARIAIGAALAGAVAAAAVTVLVLQPDDARRGGSLAETGAAAEGSSYETPEATFERVERGAAIERGAVNEGGTLRTSATQRARVRIGRSSRVELGPGSEAAVERLARQELRLRLRRGAVFVEYHPDRPGEQRMAVETAAARVEVVGTVFRVEVEPAAVTRVEVEDGTVRVVPHSGERARLVREGETLRVDSDEPAPEADESSPAPHADASGAAAAERADASLLEAAPDAGVRPSETRDEPEDRRRLSPNVRFDLAEVLMDRGRHAKARHELFAIVRRSGRPTERARAWNMVGESWMAQRRWAEAADAYRRAADAGAGTLEGANGLFALARLRQGRLDDEAGARSAFRRYLEQYPDGLHRAEARRSLCALGDWRSCRP